MLREIIIETINEAEWLSGTNDEDYSKGGMLFFDKNDTYEKEGKTTGLVHHALKHAGDVKPNLSNEREELLSNVKDIVVKYAQEAPVYFRAKSGQVTQINPEKLQQIDSPKTWRNTFDAIQDKQANGASMLDVEKTIFKHVEDLVKKYNSIVDKVIDNPIATEEDPKRNKKAIVDKEGNVLITWSDKIGTLYGTQGDPEQIAKKAVTKQ